MKPIRPEEREEKCCICGRMFKGYGNNPIPVRATGRCCDDCNSRYVIPARIMRVKR